MVRLLGLGWGSNRIAAELGCGRNTGKRYIAAGGWTGYRKRQRQRRLDGLAHWLAERFRRHRGNRAVVRQDLGVSVAAHAGALSVAVARLVAARKSLPL